MAITNNFIQFVLDQLSGWGNVQEKRMFGGAALYQDGLAFAMISNNIVYLKVDDTNKDKFIEAGSIQLKPFKNNATVLSFYSIPPDILEDADEFKEWAKVSFAVQHKRNFKLNSQVL